MKVFLMLGQSNMAGRGDPRDIPPLPSTHAFVLRNGRWQPMTEPLNIDRPIKFTGNMGTNSGVGPAASFAAAYAAEFNEDIGLVPCAEGGSSLDDWKIDGQLFLNAFYQAKLASNIGELTGIIWHQGEAECSLPERAFTYKTRFLTIINELEKRLDVKFKIVVGELGRFYANSPSYSPVYFNEVNKALNELALENRNIAIASSEGLTDRGDFLHFNAESQREFGRRYFEAYKTLL